MITGFVKQRPAIGMAVEFVSRREWGALPRPPDVNEELKVPAQHVVFCYRTRTQPCYNLEDCASSMRALQAKAMTFSTLREISYK